jgi:hypothetical protein
MKASEHQLSRALFDVQITWHGHPGKAADSEQVPRPLAGGSQPKLKDLVSQAASLPARLLIVFISVPEQIEIKTKRKTKRKSQPVSCCVGLVCLGRRMRRWTKESASLPAVFVESNAVVIVANNLA